MIRQIAEFRAALQKLFSAAQRRGQSTLDVRAADLSREVGGEREHAMTTCCAVMRAAMGLRDHVVGSDDGDALTVRYMFPHRLP